MPRSERPLKIIAGKPIELPKIASPSTAEVQQHHARYVAGLQELYKAHREARYGDAPELEVW